MANPKGFEIPAFGGLDLRDDPEQISVSGAVDSMNVLLDRPGRVRTRDGYAAFSSVLPATTSTALVMKAVYGASWFGVGTGPLLVTAFKTVTNDIKFTVTTQAGASTTFAPFIVPATTITNAWATVMGTSSTNYLVVTSDGTDDWTNFQPPATVATTAGGAGGPCAIQYPDNRLVLAKNNRVSFSNPGSLTFAVNNFVDVSPGDGEAIREMVSWNNMLFVFKQTKFAVFYGNDTDGSGNPIFNFRVIDRGQGVRSSGGAIATTEGVYFANDAGVWLTTGREVTRVSTPIDDLFKAGASLPYTSSTLTNIITNATFLRLANAHRQLVLYTGAGALMMDRDTRTWTAHNFTSVTAAGFDTTNATAVPDGREDLFFTQSGSVSAYRMSTASSTDNGSAITANYRTGFWNPGQAGAEAWIREVLLDGCGTVTVKTAANDAASLNSGQAVTLGTAPAVGNGRARNAVTHSRNVSYDFSGTAPWSLSRATAIIWGQRVTGEKSA